MSWEVSNSIVSGYVKKSISTAYVRCIVSYRTCYRFPVQYRICSCTSEIGNWNRHAVSQKKLKFETSGIRFSEVETI